jgi:hypothetical protein
VTTIAWRLGHLGGLALGGFTNWRFGYATERPEAIHFPGTAQESRGFLEGHYRAWRDPLAGLEDSEWERPLSDLRGRYARNNTFEIALRVLDEVTHHGAEVSLLRDLYSHRASPGLKLA